MSDCVVCREACDWQDDHPVHWKCINRLSTRGPTSGLTTVEAAPDVSLIVDGGFVRAKVNGVVCPIRKIPDGVLKKLK